MSFDFHALSQSLTADREETLPKLSWLEDTWRDPGAFWAALCASASPALRSRPPDRVDLYSDLIARHVATDRPAFAWYERRSRAVATVSYAELDDLTARQAAEWLVQKVEPGDVLAVVLHPGRSWLVALLAALRLGLAVSFLPPLGARYLAPRLEKAKAKHVVTDPLYLPLLKGFEKLVLRDGVAIARPHDRSHTYAAKDPCAEIFSPLRDPLLTPVPLTAGDALRSALRDGVLALSLQAGDTLAAPGFHPTQHQPALLFATLLAGATYFHLTIDDLKQDPRLLLRRPLRALGVTRAVRDLLREHPLGPVQTWSQWFKNPEEPLDAREWTDFVGAHGLEKVPAGNLLVDAAAGGASHFSVWRPGGTSVRVLPAAGVPWGLFALDGSSDEALGKSGLFALKPAKKPAREGYVLLAELGAGEYLYAGTFTLPAAGEGEPPPLPRREGRVYPRAEVLAAVADLRFVLRFVAAASFAAVPSGGPAPRSLIVLLVFTGAEDPGACAAAADGRRRAIEQALRDALGDDALPDRTLFFPLYARMKKAEVDHAWCAAQLQRGNLSAKARDPMFQKLTALRKRCVKDVPGR